MDYKFIGMLSTIDILTLICIVVLIVSYTILIAKKNTPAMRMFGLVFFCIGYAQTTMLLHSFSFYTNLKFLTYTDAMLFYFCMPLLYMIVLNITDDIPFIKPSNGINLLPSLPGFVYVVYFNRLTPQMQAYCITVKSCGVLSDNYLYAIGLLSQFVYIILIIRKIQKYLTNQSKNLTPFYVRTLHFYSWIMYVYIVFDIGLSMIIMLLDSVYDIHQVIMFCLLFLFLGIYIMAVLYFRLKAKYQCTVKQNDDGKITKTTTNLCNEIAIEIERFLAVKPLYINPHLDLQTFSKESNIPAHKISSCINTLYNTSFPEFINKQRIAFAQKKLLESKDEFIKLDFLAHECGFNSRSSFYAVFKKIVGVTPLEFQKLNKKSDSLLSNFH